MNNDEIKEPSPKEDSPIIRSYMLSYDGEVLCWKNALSVQDAIEKMSKELHICVADKFSDKHYDVENNFITTYEAKAEGYKEGQKDTAKQIFKKLDKLECSASTDQAKHSRKYHKGLGFQVINICLREYEALKKQNKVD